MKTTILGAIVACVLAGPAAAQNANGNANGGANAASFTAKNVDPVHPFGAINTYNVGVEPAQVSAWAKTLNAAQKQEMTARCAVIIQNQQNYYAETTTFCRNFPSR